MGVEKVGMEPKFINGLRVTDEETMEIAEMVLNRVNKSLADGSGAGREGRGHQWQGWWTSCQVEKKYSGGQGYWICGR